jgi:hypothetical protein
MKPILVFAGPSLPQDVEIDPAIRLMPPAACGDLVRALRHNPLAIGLVDGVFETAPTVWHKEILTILGRGVPVYGGASLGALRAAELDRYGMVGVGAIYQAYRDGALESDAAVMVSHAPAELGYRPLTLALVDAEASLGLAGLELGDRTMLRAIARHTNFRGRSWKGIIAEFARRTSGERAGDVSAKIAAVAFSQKERDTRSLLARMLLDKNITAPDFTVPRTVFLERMLENALD